ncbi:MAG: carbohydrate ABC transporter permease [Spirochaetales bacterium]|nr:carbohydrate ABC transporter permease [Spirochaetales bacterium]MBQ5365489.1 carbohydrate ABC transporter permease [Spirochaetales bacterium]
MTANTKLGPVDIIAKIFKWFFLILFLLFMILPLVWILISSFKTNQEFNLKSPFSLPAVWQFSNYANALSVSNLPRMFLHSIIVAIVTTALNLVVASMSAFALSREKFRGNNLILTFLLSGVLIPIIALMVPIMKINNFLHLYDTLGALILTYTAINLPTSIFLVHGFMSTIPKELEESATIDGCSFLQRFTKIIFPLTKPGLMTAGTLVFIYCWNEFTYAMILTISEKARTIQLGIKYFQTEFSIDYTGMLAAIVITMIPTIVVYTFMHDKIISGMTAGAVKG